MRPSRSVGLVLVFLLAMLGAASAARAQCPGTFDAFYGGGGVGFYTIDPSNPIPMVQWDPDGPGPLPTMLILGGEVIKAGAVPVDRLAGWDGAHWHALFPGIPGTYALAVFNGELIAAGRFHTQNGGPANYIARWDGAAWRPLPGLATDSTGACNALTIYNGELIAGGKFTATAGPMHSIARWDGTTWRPFGGARNLSGTVYSLAAVADGQLAVGGIDLIPSSVGETKIVKWNGSDWQTFPSLSLYAYSVRSIVEYGGDLIAGCDTQGSGAPIYRLSNGAWSMMGMNAQATRSIISAMAIYNGELYAGGSFARAVNGATVQDLARWNGAAWTQVGHAYYPVRTVMGLATYAGRLYVAAMTFEDDVTTFGVAAWDGDHFNGLVDALDGPVWATASEGPGVLVAGGFHNFGATPLNCIARFDGQSWTPLGSGLDRQARAVAVSGGTVYAGGEFTAAGGVPASHMARWDGSWHAMGGGIDGTVYALAITAGGVVAGGTFSTADGHPAANIARWDGASWQPLGPGLNGTVYEVLEYNGRLIAGGLFTGSGATALSNIAQWDGTSWQPLSAGADGYVFALHIYDGELIVGGSFTSAGGTAASKIAAWNGAQWRPLGAGRADNTDSLATFNGRLVAAGSTVPVDHFDITQWDGAAWQTVGTATGDWAMGWALAPLGSALLIGGPFTTIAGQPTNNLALLHQDCGPVCGSPDFNHDGDVATDADIEAFFACLAGNCCPTCGSADFNSDGDVATDADIEAFFRVLGGGTC